MKGRWRDPYDTYGWIRKTHHGMPLTWFVLAAKRRKPFDVGLDPAQSLLPALVEQLDFAGPEHRVSWHPSWAALSDSGVFDAESTMVHSWPGIDPNAVRSHFLRGTPGKWWKRLVEQRRLDAIKAARFAEDMLTVSTWRSWTEFVRERRRQKRAICCCCCSWGGGEPGFS